jgi:predicted DCC family thiol-disulfide oxidoreductase YuxK
VLALANESPGVAERYGLSRAELEAAAWAIDSHGRAFAGAASINRVLLELGPPWSILGRSYGSAPLRWLEDAVYRWFAANRGRFSRWGVTPESEEPWSFGS